VTLQDVADLAGVSVTTASRVVNEGARKVGPTMAARVARESDARPVRPELRRAW